jgi:hypothetical protein
MFSRYLSIVLGGVLVAFALYHWFLVNRLTTDMREKDAEIARLGKRGASLEASHAALIKANEDYKAQVEEQNTAIQVLQAAQQAEERACPAAPSPPAQCPKQRPIIQVSQSRQDNQCAALARKLDAYIVERQQQRQARRNAGAQNH